MRTFFCSAKAAAQDAPISPVVAPTKRSFSGRFPRRRSQIFARNGNERSSNESVGPLQSSRRPTPSWSHVTGATSVVEMRSRPFG